MAANRLQLEGRLSTFPEGVLVLDLDGKAVGAMSFVRLPSIDVGAGQSWDELTDNGWCTNHDSAGPILFGVDLSVSRHAPRGASARLMFGGLELTMRLGVEAVVWGSRIPRYYKRAATMTAEEYVFTRNSRGRYLDPEIQVYSKVPGLEIVGVVADYFKDEESLDYGVVLRWPNPIRHVPVLRPFSGPILRWLYARERRRSSRSS